MKPGPILLVGGLGAVALLLLMSQKKEETPAAPRPPGPTGPTGPADPCLELRNAVKRAEAALASQPANTLLSQALMLAKAAVAKCEPRVGKPSIEEMGGVDIGKLTQQLNAMTGGSPQGGLSPACSKAMQEYQLAAATAQTALQAAQASPRDAALYSAMQTAVSGALARGKAYQAAGCPPVADLDAWIRATEAALGQGPAGPSQTPAEVDPRFAADAPLQITQRPSNVPRLDSWPATRLGPSKGGGCSPGSPDLEFPDFGVWPVVSNGLVLECQCDPVCNGVTGAEARDLLNTWGAQLSTLVDPNAELGPADVAALTQAIGTAEARLRQIAPGAFGRYVAALFALFAGLWPDLDDENERAAAGHVILVTKALLASMNLNPARVPALPFVYEPRNEDGDLIVPIWSALGLFPGV